MSFQVSKSNIYQQQQVKVEGTYSMITKEKEIENDRDRIIKRFNFISNKIIDHNYNNNNNSINKGSLSEQTASIKHAPALYNTRNKMSNQSNALKTTTNSNKKQQLNSATKDMTKNTNVSLQILNTQQSDDTEKDSKCRLMVIKNALHNEINFHDDNDGDNNKEEGNESLNELNSIGQLHDIPIDNSNDDNIIKLTIEGEEEEEGEDSSSESINQNNKSNTCGTIAIGRNNANNSNINNNTNCKGSNKLQAKNRKMKQLFISNPSYNISARLLNDEIHSYNRKIVDNKEYRFITEVKHENDQLRKIKMSSFLKLSDYSIYNILSFCYENYDNLTLNKNKYLSTKVGICFTNIFENIIKKFKEKYSNILNLEGYYFKQKTFKHLKNYYPILDLIIKVKVISKDINKSYEISYSYSSKQTIYDQRWKFDIRSNGTHPIWFASEIDIYNQNISRFCYSQPVASFMTNDIIELHLNVFSKKSSINPFSITWEDLIIMDSPNGFYQKSILKCPYDYNAFYACEIENMIHTWKSITTGRHKIFEGDVRRFFGKHFSIENILYDSSRWIFYKFEMVAKSEGRIKKNHYINFDIEIISKGKAIKNEIQALGLLNSTLLADCIQVRKGTVIVLYFTDFISDSLIK